MTALLLWDWCVLIQCRAHHDNGVPRYPEVRQDAVIRRSGRSSSHSGRHPSIHIGCRSKEHPSCAAEMELPISGMTSVFELCGFLQAVIGSLGRSRRRSKQDPDPGTPVPGLPEGAMGTRWVPVHEGILQGSICSAVRRWRRGCLVARNHGKDWCLLSMPSSSPSPPPTSRLFLCGRCRYPLLALSRWLQPLVPLNLSHIAPGGWRPPRNSSCRIPEPIRLVPPPPVN